MPEKILMNIDQVHIENTQKVLWCTFFIFFEPYNKDRAILFSDKVNVVSDQYGEKKTGSIEDVYQKLCRIEMMTVMEFCAITWNDLSWGPQ